MSQTVTADSGPAAFANPLADVALGDPFVLRHRGKFYLYGTNDGPPLADGRAIPVFVSTNLLDWTPLGGALEPAEPQADHWAPEVIAWNGRFYMVVSYGDVDTRGHELWVAVADRPEGPFVLRSRVSDPADRFSIDGAYLLDDDGRLYLYRCLDFVAHDDPPHGTGIVVQPMADPFTPVGPPATVLRAHADWHLFERDRPMPLYGGQTFEAWTTIEGAAPVKRQGRYFCGYSGGNFGRDYGTGEAVAETPLGPYLDLRGREGPLFRTTPGLVEGPGHFSVIQPDLVHDWIVLHGRRPDEHVRRVWLCPAEWGAEGVTIGPLTVDPQPAPPLPTHLFDLTATGPDSPGWQLQPDAWQVDPHGLRHRDPTPGHAWCAGLTLEGDWAIEVHVAFGPDSRTAVGGLVLRAGLAELSARIESPTGTLRLHDARGRDRSCPLTLPAGTPFHAAGYHVIGLQRRGPRVEARLDGVLLDSTLEPPTGPARLGLTAEGDAVFDALAITLLGDSGGQAS